MVEHSPVLGSMTGGIPMCAGGGEKWSSKGGNAPGILPCKENYHIN